MQRILVAVITILAIIASPLTPAHAATIVNQGDEVFVGGNVHCVIGYIDKNTRRAYIADHCAYDPGTEKVAYAKDRRAIGTITGISEGGKPTNDATKDVNYITLYDNVTAGENVYSGDARVRIADIKQGDKACMLSRMNGDITGCFPVAGTEGNMIIIDGGIVSQGDSGGPVWIEGKGFAGTLSGLAMGFTGTPVVVATNIDDANCSPFPAPSYPFRFQKSACGGKLADMSVGKHFFPVLGFNILAMLVVFAVTVLTLGIGSIVAIPAMSIMQAYAYRQLSGGYYPLPL